MSEVVPDLVAGIIRRPDGTSDFLFRKDHDQIEIPAGKIVAGEVAISALGRIMHDTLGIEITDAHKIDGDPSCNPMPFVQGGKEHHCELWQISAYNGTPRVFETLLYEDKIISRSLHSLHISRKESPLLQAVKKAVKGNQVTLRY